MSSVQQLSQEQCKAAFCFDAPVCILAGAGSGKTRVITHRITKLVTDMGVPPYNILGVTFTNKAAREMRERVERLLGEASKEVILGTFHGLASRFLRRYGEMVSVDRDFLIYDQDDSSKLIKSIIKEGYQLPKDELNALAKKVIKYREVQSQGEAFPGSQDEQIIKLLNQYNARLQKAHALDFCGLLEKFYELLQSDSGGFLIKQRVRHLVVDEYQDINSLQSKIVHALVKNADSAAIVGDDDQSIYGWRGASAHYMQQFLNDFKDSKLFRLVENYRSTKPILDCANAVISNNKERLGKDLQSVTGDGLPIKLSRFFRDTLEASSIVKQSIRLFEQQGSNYEVAVLMRTNAQSRPLEEALHKARMPYRMVGGMKFYDRKEIKDILAALRVIIYGHSDVDMIRLLNALPLGIGKKTQEALSVYAGPRGLSFFETMKDEQHQASALQGTRSKKKICDLVNLLSEVRQEIVNIDKNGQVHIVRADEALILVIDRLGFARLLEKKNDDEAEARLENIEQLVQAAVSFVEEAEAYGESCDAQSFLESVALISKDEAILDNSESRLGTVTLMTLHAAKGLEFDAVFIVGLEEGMLPHGRSLFGQDEENRASALEEERRLLYVGMTRARTRLFLSFCQERFMHGKTTSSTPSRFLQELREDSIAVEDRWLLGQIVRQPAEADVFNHYQGGNFVKKGFQEALLPRSNTDSLKLGSKNYFVEYDADEIFNREQMNFKPGDRVRHKTYDLGKVISISGSGKLVRVNVRFDVDGSVRTIMAPYLNKC